MSERTRLSPDARREIILKAAIKEAERLGFNNVQRPAIAARAGVSVSLVGHYLGTVAKMQRAIMREAIRTDNARIIAQGLAVRHPQCRKLSERQKEHVRASI